KALFKNLNFDNTQIIYSTHSTQISESSKISRVNIISKKEKANDVDVCQPSTGLTPQEISKLERYLDAKRGNLLFAKKVVLVEGDAEEIMIPAMFFKHFGISLDELGVTIVNVGSTGFKNIASIFHESRLRKRCAIITDLDKSIYSSIKKTDGKILHAKKRKAERSEKLGKERKKILDDFCKGNDYVKAFFAEQTFEVEFINFFQNETYLKSVVSEVYSNENKILTVNKDLSSPSIEICGDRVLSVAKYMGKGWLALMLADKIDHNVVIPPYILDALSFSIGKFNRVILISVLKYKRSKLGADENKDIAPGIEEILDKLNGKELLQRQEIRDLISKVFGIDDALVRMI
ncbi:TPA: ATP-dependent endonuclease, partial [Klebsiella quasipneumoniae subsp. quasipneumoniae]|nr:ATP-dependent endonuclease [Klebsiella quasipneumoniae subsp. quasipneumoniae]